MLNTTATAGVAAAPAASRAERELKFALPAGRADHARRWLDVVCRRDPRYPSAIVWTIYYDTPDLRSLGEKVNSDYLKCKVRLRWYSDLAGVVSGEAFIEAKSRVGTGRTKVRTEVPDAADRLSPVDLQDARLAALPLLLRARGVVLSDLWRPVLQIRYRRDRFVEPVSGTRVSLDAEIAAAAVNPHFVQGADTGILDAAVLEVKGEAEELPSALRPLLALGAKKCSFSKYLAVYARATRHTL